MPFVSPGASVRVRGVPARVLSTRATEVEVLCGDELQFVSYDEIQLLAERVPTDLQVYERFVHDVDTDYVVVIGKRIVARCCGRSVTGELDHRKATFFNCDWRDALGAMMDALKHAERRLNQKELDFLGCEAFKMPDTPTTTLRRASWNRETGTLELGLAASTFLVKFREHQDGTKVIEGRFELLPLISEVSVHVPKVYRTPCRFPMDVDGVAAWFAKAGASEKIVEAVKREAIDGSVLRSMSACEILTVILDGEEDPRGRILDRALHWCYHDVSKDQVKSWCGVALDGPKIVASRSGNPKLAAAHFVARRAEQENDDTATVALPREPVVKVVALGGTGAGKSSLLNALVGEVDVLPTNCMRACGGRRFTALQDRDRELERRLRRHRRVPRPRDVDTDDGAARPVFRTLPAQKRRSRCRLRALGRRHPRRRRARDGRRILRSQTRGSSSRQGLRPTCATKSTRSSTRRTRERAAWPLVRRVSLQGPWPALSMGVELLDAPGIADQNAARNRVVQSAMAERRGAPRVERASRRQRQEFASRASQEAP